MQRNRPLSWESPIEGRPPRHLCRLAADGLAVMAALPDAIAAAPARRQRPQLREA